MTHRHILDEKTGEILDRSAVEFVCECLQVRRSEVQEAVRQGADSLPRLGAELGCGTVCGACVPRLTSMLGKTSWRDVDAKIVRIAAEVVRIRLTPLDQRPLEAGLAGQHVLLSGVVNGRRVERPYSLVSPAGRTDCYELAVARHPQGRFTSWLFDETVSERKRVRVSAPRGDFVWRPSERPTVCMVAGIGVTPAIGILRSAVPTAATPLYIDCSYRNAASGAFVEELLLANLRPHTHIRMRWTSKEGRIKKPDLERLVAAARGADFYLCGPSAYMETVTALLFGAGVPNARIHREHFVSSGVSLTGTVSRPAQLVRRSNPLAYGVGLLGCGLALALLPSAAGGALVRPGPANTGHELVDCVECHVAAAGTTRQQIQANVRFWMGQRDQRASFGFREVGNDTCGTCHDNPDDRHPVYRFKEPRFAELSQMLGPDRCTSCHLEHQGGRTQSDADICRHCHEDLAFDGDPLDQSHEALAADERWETCLGCHDYHGNHVHESPNVLSEALDASRVDAYLAGADSPYGSPIRQATGGTPAEDDP